MHRLEKIWIELRSSLWFVPSLLVLGSVLLAYSLIKAHRVLGTAWLQQWPYLFGAEADGARGMLSAIATSIITVAGVTFSITVAALAQASSQYSPLILRNFMRDRANQVVLGVFGGIFVYCLVVLRVIRNGEPQFVPSLAVLVALMLAIAAIGFLLFFIHHIASLLQAGDVLAMVAADTQRAIDEAYPREIDSDDPECTHQPDPTASDGLVWYEIVAKETGYIQALNTAPLIDVACRMDAIVRMEHDIGDFVVAGLPLVSLALRHGEPTDRDGELVEKAFVIGRNRTIEQDVGFGIRQIVDMGVKALSPGINDPTTACSCLHYLSAIIIALGGRQITTPVCFVDGRTRVLAHGPTVSGVRPPRIGVARTMA